MCEEERETSWNGRRFGERNVRVPPGEGTGQRVYVTMKGFTTLTMHSVMTFNIPKHNDVC